MKISRIIRLVLSLAMCLLAISSCQQENALPSSSSEKIKTTVSATDLLTKSSYAANGMLTQTIVLDEEDGLLLQEIVSDNLSQPFGDAEPDTKGTVVTTENIPTVYGRFGMEGFVNTTPENVPEGVVLTGDKYVDGKVDYSNGTWTLTDIKSGKEYPWLRNVSYSFWSFAPMTHSGTFAYVTAAGKEEPVREKMTITGYEMPTSSEDQKDLLVAFNAHEYPSDGKSVDILFRHALADIYFDVSPIAEYGLTVNEITISGANSKGDCEISSTNLYERVETGFDWTSKTSADFTMKVADDHFFMIPQNFSGTITISLSNGKTLTTSLKTNWLAGKYYTYKLTYNGFEYEFKLVDETQSNISYVNTSNSQNTDINVSSTLSYFGVPQDVDWKIKSYTNIATGETETVDGTSFEKGSFAVSKNGKSLKVTSLARTPVFPGSHSFWINENDDRKDFLDWSPEPLSGITDLSKFNFQTEQAMTMTTANCYIVRHAGTYKIPLVYGNAVKDGTENTDAYSPNATGGDYRLDKFKNHLNNTISSAFIENNDGCIVDADKCTILWQDKAAVVSNLSIVGDVQAAGSYDVSNVRYLQFTVDESTICQSNALLAIKDNSGEIIWSWHIWVSNNPAILSNSIRVTNSRSCSYDYFPVTSLGWLDPSYYMPLGLVVELVQEESNKTLEIIINQEQVQATGSSGTFYQFGRKDPFYSGLISSPAQGSAWTHTTVGGGDTSKAANYAAAIKSPTLMYTYGYIAQYCLFDWCKEFYYNVWSGKATTHGATSDKDNTFTKTVYDPSPAGYMVPPAGAFSSFQDSAILKSDGFATCYKRNEEDTTGISFSDVGSFTGYDCAWNFYTNQFASGYYWSSSSAKPADMTHNVTYPCVYDNQYCFCIVIANGWGTPDWPLDKAFLCAVRPVEE